MFRVMCQLRIDYNYVCYDRVFWRVRACKVNIFKLYIFLVFQHFACGRVAWAGNAKGGVSRDVNVNFSIQRFLVLVML